MVIDKNVLDKKDIPPVTKEEIRKTLAALQRVKAAEEDRAIEGRWGDRGRKSISPIYQMLQDLGRTGILEER